MSKLELRVGKKVIAACDSERIDEMVSLVEDFREIRCEDKNWEVENDTLPAFALFDEALKSSGMATADSFDIFDKCEVWSVMPSGDSVRACLVWHKGF